MCRGNLGATAAADLALVGAVTLSACGADGSASVGAHHTNPAVSANSAPPPAGPTSGWGPGMWGGNAGSGMMNRPGS
jgi:hypothetical protein